MPQERRGGRKKREETQSHETRLCCTRLVSPPLNVKLNAFKKHVRVTSFVGL